MEENTNLNTNIWADPKIIKTIARGGVVVMPTDTIYGIVCSALDAGAVQRVYDIRNRDPEKPCIILIKDFSEVENFVVVLSESQKKQIEKYSSSEEARPVSVVLDCPLEKFSYLHRGTNSLAFRVPKQTRLLDLLSKTGPLIAPSANIEKFPPSESIEDARAYFGDKADLYVGAGKVVGQSSKVVRINLDGSETILRA